MTPSNSGYVYSVRRAVGASNDVDVALVRQAERRGPLGIGRRLGEPLVLYHQGFRAMLDLGKLEHYAAELERVAEHLRDGTYGCFIDTVPRDGSVAITLWERWFDGDRLHCESVASHAFDADDDGALVGSAEFKAALESWAEDRNAERERAFLDASVEDAARIERATERAAAADELARILASAGRPA